jgi:putative two-component system response regulator
MQHFRSKTPATKALDEDQDALKQMRILILDDEIAQLKLHTYTLERAGFSQLKSSTDVQEGITIFRSFKPELLVLDWNLGNVKGSTIIKAIRELLHQDRFFPILVVTADSRATTKLEILDGGANDFMPKPYSSKELSWRVSNLLKIRQLDSFKHHQNEKLEALVEARTKELDQAYQEVIVRLGRATEYRDDVTGKHVWHVASLTEKLALELGVAQNQASLMMRAARLHDVGKIAIPDGILYKPALLTAAEFEIIKTHTTIGAELLSGGKSDLIQMAERIALSHHERWDGQGYPQGLKEEAIPLEARIVALADSFDALTRDSAYKRACSLQEAITEIKSQRARQFDPTIVDAFLKLFQQGEISPQKTEKMTLMDPHTTSI